VVLSTGGFRDQPASGRRSLDAGTRTYRDEGRGPVDRSLGSSILLRGGDGSHAKRGAGLTRTDRLTIMPGRPGKDCSDALVRPCCPRKGAPSSCPTGLRLCCPQAQESDPLPGEDRSLRNSESVRQASGPPVGLSEQTLSRSGSGRPRPGRPRRERARHGLLPSRRPPFNPDSKRMHHWVDVGLATRGTCSLRGRKSSEKRHPGYLWSSRRVTMITARS
jgi:hypothetical protein